MDVRPQFGSGVGTSFQIDVARLSDLGGLLALSKNLGLSGESWRKLIADGTAVCAKDGGKIVGFYAANHLSLLAEDEHQPQFRAALSVLCNRFRLVAERITFGACVAVAPAYTQSDLRAQMLRALLRGIALRYPHLFTYCRKDNPIEFETQEREGWRCFQEEDDICYLTLDVAKALRRLASQLVLRAPISTNSGYSSIPTRN